MRHGFFCLLLVWHIAAAASVDLGPSGQSEFRLGVLLPRQRQGDRTNLQAFAGALGGVRASAITNTGDPERPFGVDGDTFVLRPHHVSLGLFPSPGPADSTDPARLRDGREPGVR